MYRVTFGIVIYTVIIIPLEIVRIVSVENSAFDRVASAPRSGTGAPQTSPKVHPSPAPLVVGSHDEGHGTAAGFQSFVAGAPVNSARLGRVVFSPLFLCPSLRHSGSVFPLHVGHGSSVRPPIPPFDGRVGPHSLCTLRIFRYTIRLHVRPRFAHCFVPTSIYPGRCKRPARYARIIAFSRPCRGRHLRYTPQLMQRLRFPGSAVTFGEREPRKIL